MRESGIHRLPFIIFMVLQATRWKVVQGVDYRVTMYIYNAPGSGTTAEVFGQLTGTTGTTASVSFGKNWADGATSTHVITNPKSIGFLKTLAVTKAQTGITNDDNLRLVKATVESTAMKGIATFLCSAPACNFKWPNLIIRLDTAVDGGWSEWKNTCSCKTTNDTVRIRTCTNPPKYFTGKDCVGHDKETVKDGCLKTCHPTATTGSTKITTSSDTLTPTATVATTTDDEEEPTKSPLIVYGIPILASLVAVAIIVTIALCIYCFCFAKKEKGEPTKPKPNQVTPHNGNIEEGTGKPTTGRPFIAKPVRQKVDSAGVPKQYISTLPMFGANAEKRELFGYESGDSQTSLIREDSRTSTPVNASLPSVQGQEENLYSEVAAPKDEVAPQVGGVPVLVGATKWSSRTSDTAPPPRAIHRMITPHTISLPGNTIIRAGSVLESEDIHEVT